MAHSAKTKSKAVFCSDSSLVRVLVWFTYQVDWSELRLWPQFGWKERPRGHIVPCSAVRWRRSITANTETAAWCLPKHLDCGTSHFHTLKLQKRLHCRVSGWWRSLRWQQQQLLHLRKAHFSLLDLRWPLPPGSFHRRHHVIHTGHRAASACVGEPGVGRVGIRDLWLLPGCAGV